MAAKTPKPKDPLTLADVAEELQISRRHVTSIITMSPRNPRPLRTYRIGRCVRVARKDLDVYVAQCRNA